MSHRLTLTGPSAATRAQILSHLTFLGFTPRESYDIILSKSHLLFYAWVLHLTPQTRKLIMKGPPASSCEGAFEMLLETTAEMVAEEMGEYVEVFERQISRMVGGGGFVLEGVPGKRDSMEDEIVVEDGELKAEVDERDRAGKPPGVAEADSLFGEPMGNTKQAAALQMEAPSKAEAETAKQRVKRSLRAMMED